MLHPIQRTFARYFKTIFGLATDPLLHLSTDIIAVLNMQPLLDGRDDVTWLESALVVGAASVGRITFTVPASEQWDVKMVGAIGPGSAVATFNPVWGFRPNQTIAAATRSYGIDPVSQIGVPSTNDLLGGRYFDTPLVLTAGDSLICTWGNASAGALTLNAGVLRRVRAIS